MSTFKNVIVGFAISFIGSLPLGYLNIIGYTIHEKYGISSLIQFLLGIITVEFFVIYFTLVFAEKIASNKKLLKRIEQFSILFFLILTILATIQILSVENNHTATYINHNFFLNGILLNCINLMQIPFWTGWSIYLVSNKYINVKKYNKISYLIATLIGTLAGMTTFIMILAKLAEKISFFKNIINYIFLITFLTLFLIQAIKYYKKHLKSI
ncbi:MAG: hypothetical protein BM557_00465 [Flavobacterium sp. MedPE-SWcel]|uniref:hypothetical protein n=1 Tax=uncultured Flavobacterium sp. TaxID=165435 RepID=UPI0009137EC7|nr:hypothetical protein [uncultured Flavobacterium sp.]OIQ22495.1 MAG: hypothetical protein BM557_00465 [Flavobacterium sp. MedPE-SWcel]